MISAQVVLSSLITFYSLYVLYSLVTSDVFSFSNEPECTVLGSLNSNNFVYREKVIANSLTSPTKPRNCLRRSNLCAL